MYVTLRWPPACVGGCLPCRLDPVPLCTLLLLSGSESQITNPAKGHSIAEARVDNRTAWLCRQWNWRRWQLITALSPSDTTTPPKGPRQSVQSSVLPCGSVQHSLSGRRVCWQQGNLRGGSNLQCQFFSLCSVFSLFSSSPAAQFSKVSWWPLNEMPSRGSGSENPKQYCPSAPHSLSSTPSPKLAGGPTRSC